MKLAFQLLCLSLLISSCGLKGGDSVLQSDVDALIDKYQDDLDACRDLYTKRHPKRALGTVVMRVLVAPSGAAYSVEPVEVFKGGEALANCLGTKMLNWDMGRTGGRDVSIRITVNFSKARD